MHKTIPSCLIAVMMFCFMFTVPAIAEPLLNIAAYHSNRDGDSDKAPLATNYNNLMPDTFKSDNGATNANRTRVAQRVQHKHLTPEEIDQLVVKRRKEVCDRVDERARHARTLYKNGVMTLEEKILDPLLRRCMEHREDRKTLKYCYICTREVSDALFFSASGVNQSFCIRLYAAIERECKRGRKSNFRN